MNEERGKGAKLWTACNLLRKGIWVMGQRQGVGDRPGGVAETRIRIVIGNRRPIHEISRGLDDELGVVGGTRQVLARGSMIPRATNPRMSGRPSKDRGMGGADCMGFGVFVGFVTGATQLGVTTRRTKSLPAPGVRVYVSKPSVLLRFASEPSLETGVQSMRLAEVCTTNCVP